jgi:hypothetical protein
MTALTALASTTTESRSWSALLQDAIRPEFRVDVYVPQASDRVLFGALCAVSGCPGRGAHHVKRDHHLCISHTKKWRKDALPDVEQWVRTGARPLKTLKLAVRCCARGCPRSVYQHALCYPHYGRWNLAERPPRAAWAAAADAVSVSKEDRCRLPGCRFPAMGRRGFCDTHNAHFASGRKMDRAATAQEYVDRAARVKLSSAPRYDVRRPGRVARA